MGKIAHPRLQKVASILTDCPVTSELRVKGASVGRVQCHIILVLYCVCSLLHRTRMVVRIMLMVPIYAVSSLISLFSLDVAFIIDAIRDVYEVRCHSPKLFRLRSFPLGLRNLLLFPAIARISRRGALAAHPSAWPPTQSTPFSHERIPARARCQ